MQLFNQSELSNRYLYIMYSTNSERLSVLECPISHCGCFGISESIYGRRDTNFQNPEIYIGQNHRHMKSISRYNLPLQKFILSRPVPISWKSQKWLHKLFPNRTKMDKRNLFVKMLLEFRFFPLYPAQFFITSLVIVLFGHLFNFFFFWVL